MELSDIRRAAQVKDDLDGILIRSLTPEQGDVYYRITDLQMHRDGVHPFPEEFSDSLEAAEALARKRRASERLAY